MQIAVTPSEVPATLRYLAEVAALVLSSPIDEQHWALGRLTSNLREIATTLDEQAAHSKRMEELLNDDDET